MGRLVWGKSAWSRMQVMLMKGEKKKESKLPEDAVTPAIQVNTEPKSEGVSFIEYPKIHSNGTG